MALHFGAAASNRVNVGSGAALDNLTTFTYLLWFRPRATGLVGGLLTKGTGGGASRRSFEVANGGSGTNATSLYGIVDLGTTDATANTAASIYAADEWVCAAMAYDDATKVVTIYKGNLTTPITSAATGSAGSGSTGDNSATDQFIGVYGAGTSGSANQDTALAAIFNRVLTEAELQSWQFYPRMMSGCVGFWRLGRAGTGTQPDYSGNSNAGTVTGATVADDVPLAIPFTIGRSYGWQGAYTVAAASARARLMGGKLANESLLMGGLAA